MNNRNWLYVICAFSAIWQPSHHHLMTSLDISMSMEVHSLISLMPYLIIAVMLIAKNYHHDLKN